MAGAKLEVRKQAHETLRRMGLFSWPFHRSLRECGPAQGVNANDEAAIEMRVLAYVNAEKWATFVPL